MVNYCVLHWLHNRESVSALSLSFSNKPAGAQKNVSSWVAAVSAGEEATLQRHTGDKRPCMFRVLRVFKSKDYLAVISNVHNLQSPSSENVCELLDFLDRDSRFISWQHELTARHFRRNRKSSVGSNQLLFFFWETTGGGGRIIKIVLAPPQPRYNQNHRVNSLTFTEVYPGYIKQQAHCCLKRT